jgi:hypothetical protein
LRLALQHLLLNINQRRRCGGITALLGGIDVALRWHGEEDSVGEDGADRDNDFT